MRVVAVLLFVALLVVAGGCGSGQRTDNAPLAFNAPVQAGLTTLPADGVQPWESVDARGFVVPARNASAFTSSSEFALGAERFLEGEGASDNGDATSLASGDGSGIVSYAVYRFTLGGVQPSAISIDANLHDLGGGPSEYWVALSDYGQESWQWHGPFSEAQVTLSLESGDHLSPLGNTFVAVAVYDGNQVDVVGVGVNPEDTSDTTAPPAPSAPAATPVAGGLELAWTDVIAADLAGYQIYWSFSPFTSASDNGVQSLSWLENTTRLVLPVALSRDIWVALSAVDINGNESELSPVLSARKLAGAGAIAVNVEVSTTTAQRSDSVTLTATGAELYDIDTDGDGDFDITGDATGTATIDTSATGIIRPRVRGTNSDGTAVALGSVSLIVSGNQRPVASAQVAPASGPAPLDCTFTGTGEDFDGTIVEYAWDFDGDGIFDHTSPADGITAETLTAPGLYNAKLRVTDDEAAWDVDTVSISVAPHLVVLSATPVYTTPGEHIDLLAVTSEPGVNYDWDLDGDGSFEFDSGTSNVASTSLDEPGLHLLRVAVTFDGGGTAAAVIQVRIRGWRVPDPLPVIGALYTGLHSSMTVVAGKPAICFYDYSTDRLMYVRATDPEGTLWGDPVVVDSGSVGSDSSLAVVNGRPAIAYYDSGMTRLKYAVASNAAGSAWGTPIEIDSGGAVGDSVVLRVVAGNPAVCYQDTTTANDAALLYSRATDADGTAWGAPVLVDNNGDTGYECAMAIIDGRPAIFYAEYAAFPGPQYWYVRAQGATGSTWNVPQETYITSRVTGGKSSLLEVEGLPLASCCENTGIPTLTIARTDKVDGNTGTWKAIQLDSLHAGYVSSLATVNGYPAVAYWVSGDMLRYCRAVSKDGSIWPQPEPAVGKAQSVAISLLEVNGSPALSFTNLDGANDTLNLGYARLY